MASAAQEELLMEKDYSGEVDEQLPLIVSKLSANGANLDACLAEALALEKKTRLAADVVSTVRIAKAIVQMCVDSKNWTALSDNIALLCKRRAQMRRVVVTVVQEGSALVDGEKEVKTLTFDEKTALIEVLRTVRRASDSEVRARTTQRTYTRRQQNTRYSPNPRPLSTHTKHTRTGERGSNRGGDGARQADADAGTHARSRWRRGGGVRHPAGDPGGFYSLHALFSFFFFWLLPLLSEV
jgi:hypothetical protein